MEDDAPEPDATRADPSSVGASAATHSLLRDLPENGVPFSEFMQRALYDPEHGYYARGTRQVGRMGDFFTSVSVGPLFGALLARRFVRWWRECGGGGRWRLLEIGAHDGSLAVDVLSGIAMVEPMAYESLEYRIAEPLDALRVCQRTSLSEHGGKVDWVTDLSELAADPAPGIVFGNELLDALPFHVIQRCKDAWHEWGVAPDPDAPGTLRWCDLGPVAGVLAEKASRLDSAHLPDGYRTEVRSIYTELHEKIASILTHGLALWIDYGFARPEYYDPARVQGTLRTFSKHHAGDDPFASPGSMDITAHVDFTAVAEDATEAGFTLADFQNQGAWLTREAKDWLVQMEATPDLQAIRQFQTLIHPAHLGNRFHVIELVRGGDGSASAAVMRRCALNG